MKMNMKKLLKYICANDIDILDTYLTKVIL